MPAFETYLVTPLISDAAAFRPVLEDAVAALKPASVLLTLPALDERGVVNLIKTLAPVVQQAGAAVLVTAGAQAAVRGGADGVHAASAVAAAALRTELTGERIVGAGGLLSRHDAMDAGESGVDYVMFGEPQPDGTLMTASALLERAAWWAEIFETPCVAYAASADMVAPLAFTKAEFIALGPWCFAAPAATMAAVTQARAGVVAGASAV